ncbi:glycosyltransferase [Teichococcus vastitatis]|uniref:glycosyltransferase n=1 Tax=Teichococcus vastitatis TaxID=2307076 RepID=UPI000E768EDE|nr:glycosyltransferase [Pseudoroseomonas vastitatis]
MRVAVQTLGTRGDIQPYLTLALELTHRGNHVQIAAPTQFEAMITGHGLEFAPV